jgi:hypothetical protein
LKIPLSIITNPVMIIMKNLMLFLSIVLLWSCQPKSIQQVEISGDLRVWHKVELTIDGPNVTEHDRPNPFLDYRLTVTFKNGDKTYVVPEFFAADGNAAETSADSGDKWKVRFRPDKPGIWDYTVSFKRASNIAVGDNLNEGESVEGDGLSGQMEIIDSDKEAPDFRGEGRVQIDGRYLRHASSGTYFLKRRYPIA